MEYGLDKRSNALKTFNISESQINFSSLENHLYLNSNDNITKIDILFQKIEKNND